ncbi:presenilins-associated rhomboid-like protein, mitochondrial [Scleropages formosus]|uniref:rhomboid protease n=1 Tax=Scleropages formosus TaxID=113540 RepID=A0A8C9W3P9_SCLFO|nr:presenilins-associated rhomboid-like protein, mitochondrial [Scleropages formosus]
MAWRGCFLGRSRGGAVFCSVTRNGWTLFSQPRCTFRKAPKKAELRKGDGAEGDLAGPQLEAVTHEANPASFGRLLRPLVFTVGFTGGSFGAAAIWQYESLKARVQTYFDELRADWLEKLRPQKQGDVRKQVNQWWNGLSEGQRTVTGIIAANALVFCCWRLPSLQRSMVKYFTSNPASKALCSPMLLSTFSHFSLLHMAANMYVLWSFSSSIVSLLGREQFVAMYLSAGVISTFVSYVCKTATGRLGPSLGASGAIMAVLAAVCTKMPEAKLAIILLPMFTFTAGSALKAIVAMDTAGLVLGWRFFDHAAHLGGALFGIWYILYGHELIWKNREPLVKIWHNMRTKGPGGGDGSL